MILLRTLLCACTTFTNAQHRNGVIGGPQRHGRLISSRPEGHDEPHQQNVDQFSGRFERASQIKSLNEYRSHRKKTAKVELRGRSDQYTEARVQKQDVFLPTSEIPGDVFDAEDLTRDSLVENDSIVDDDEMEEKQAIVTRHNEEPYQHDVYDREGSPAYTPIPSMRYNEEPYQYDVYDGEGSLAYTPRPSDGVQDPKTDPPKSSPTVHPSTSSVRPSSSATVPSTMASPLAMTSSSPTEATSPPTRFPPFPAEITSSPTKTSPSPAEVTSPPTKIPSFQTEETSTPTKTSPSPAEVSSSPDSISSSPAEVSSPPTKISSFPYEVTSSPTKNSPSLGEVSYSPASISSSPAAGTSPPSMISSWPAEVTSPPTKTLSSPATVSSYPNALSSSPATVSTPPAVDSSPSTEGPSGQFPTPSIESVPNCTTDEEGFFGYTAGSDALVKYLYEIEYKPDGDLLTLLKAVEKAVGDSVLPAVFPDVCEIPNSTATGTDSTTGNSTGTGSIENAEQSLTQSRERKLVYGRRLEAVGLSPQPNETVLLGVRCVGQLQDPSNNCAVTQGSLTLFLNQTATATGETEAAIAAIQKDMMKGQYNYISSSIVRVSFLPDEKVGNSSSNTGAASGKSTTSSAGLPIWAYVLIAIGALLFIGLIIFFLRRGQASRTGKRDVDARDERNFRDELINRDDDSYEPPDDYDESDDGRVYRV